jgi:hypothetical protein
MMSPRWDYFEQRELSNETANRQAESKPFGPQLPDSSSLYGCRYNFSETTEFAFNYMLILVNMINC